MKTAAKDFKMTELGPIPKDWEVKRVDELAEVGRGRVISQVEIDKSSRHLYPVYSSQTLNNGEMGRIDTYDFDGEYVTWTTDGVNAGRVFYRTGRFNCTNVCGTLKIKEADAKFVAMSLGRQTQSYVATNLANPKLMNGVMKQVPFILPPLPEQRKIAVALSDVDEMIAALEKLIEKKRKIKTGAMQRLLTGKTRLPGFKGAWVEKRLGDAFEFHSNNTFSRASMIEGRGQIYNIHYGDVLIRYGAVLDCNKMAIPSLDDAASSVCKRDFLKDGDVIIADTAEDETVGKAVEVINVGDRLIVSGLHTIFLRPKEGTFALGWLGYYVNSTAFHDQLLPLITGT